MNLEELDITLAALDPAVVTNADGLTSYRGFYKQLALTPGNATVGMLREECKYALEGGIFEGYKGGSFVMDADTPIWFSEWGECSNLAITGIHFVEGGKIEFTTYNVRDYLF